MKKYENFCNAYRNLKDIYSYEEPYNNVELTGLVGLYEICFEQAWKMMKEKLQNIKEEALKAIEAADMPEKLNDVRVKFLGKKGELTAVLKGMKDVAPEDRPKV